MTELWDTQTVSGVSENWLVGGKPHAFGIRSIISTGKPEFSLRRSLEAEDRGRCCCHKEVTETDRQT